MMLALYEVLHARGHVVTEIVETEFIVRTESHIALIRPSASVAVRLMLVNAIHGKSMEHVQRSHPLGVSFGEVVVHGHHVDTLSCKRIQENRKRRDEGLSFTGSHLGNLSLMEDDTSDDLHVIVDHIPGDLVSAGHPMVLPQCLVAFDLHEVMRSTEIPVEIIGSNFHYRILRKSARRRLHYRECVRKNLVQNLLDLSIFVLHKLIGLSSKRLLLTHRNITFKLFLDFGNSLFKRLLDFTDSPLEVLSLRSQLVVRKFVNAFVRGKYFFQNRPDLFHISLGLCAEHFLYYVY